MSFGPDSVLSGENTWPAMWYYNANLPVLVANYAVLRTIVSGNITSACVVDSAGQKLFGIFEVDTTDHATADDGGTVIVDTSGRRWKRVSSLRLVEVLPQDFGALVNGVANDGAALRLAHASFPATGGKYIIPRATYITGAVGGSCLGITKPLLIEGGGGVYTAINPSAATAADDTIAIVPSVGIDHTMTGISRVSLHNPNNGTRVGRHGIFLDTTEGVAAVSKYTVRDIIIGQGSGLAFYHLNDPALNPDGGMFCGLFENVLFKGGAKFENSGDSISVMHSVLTGTNIGVQASLVAGASLFEVQGCNITNSGGAIRLDRGDRSRVLGNNIEHSAVGAVANNGSSIVFLAGTNGTMYNGVVKENLISGFGVSDAISCVKLTNQRGTLIEDNTILSGVAGLVVGINIGGDCHDIRVGPNGYNVAITTQVIDNGIGTMGVIKTPALQNGWVPYLAGTQSLQYIKTKEGVVYLSGSIKNGTFAANTIIAVLPTGFIPALAVRGHAMFSKAGVPTICNLIIDTGGNVIINNVTEATQLDINMFFMAANLANTVAV